MIGSDFTGKFGVIRQEVLIDNCHMDACPGDPLLMNGPDSQAGVFALLHHLGLKVLAAF